MDIERLKELKAEFEKVRKYNDMHCMSTVTEDDVLELIDEAIANQPVTKTATGDGTTGRAMLKCCMCGDVFDIGYEMPNGDCVCATHECCYEYCKCEGKKITQKSEAIEESEEIL